MKVKRIVHWRQESYEKEPVASFFAVDMTDYGYILGCQTEIEVGDPPTHAEMNFAQIEELKKEQGKHQAAIVQLEGKIQSLRAIELKGASS